MFVWLAQFQQKENSNDDKRAKSFTFEVKKKKKTVGGKTVFLLDYYS